MCQYVNYEFWWRIWATIFAITTSRSDTFYCTALYSAFEKIKNHITLAWWYDSIIYDYIKLFLVAVISEVVLGFKLRSPKIFGLTRLGSERHKPETRFMLISIMSISETIMTFHWLFIFSIGFGGKHSHSTAILFDVEFLPLVSSHSPRPCSRANMRHWILP